MVTLVRNRDTGKDPLFLIMAVSFSVLVPSPVPVQCQYVITRRLSGSKVVTERKALNITFYACVGDN